MHDFKEKAEILHLELMEENRRASMYLVK